MTTVIGIQGDGYCLIGADSRITTTDSNGYPSQINVLRQNQSKICSNKGYLIGTAGDLRAINLLTHAWQPPTTPPNLTGKKLDEHITTKTIPSLKHLFETSGYTNHTDTTPNKAGHDSELLLAINGTIYHIDGDYSWFQDTDNHYAIGTGTPYALATLTTLPTPTTPQQAKAHIHKALQTAHKYDPNTGPPYHTSIQHTPKTRKN